MAFIRPRFGYVRPLAGVQQRETDSAGEILAGVTMYTNTPDGREEYEVNYITLGARSDSMQRALQHLQGDELTTRIVGESDADTPYVGTLQENGLRTKKADATSAE